MAYSAGFPIATTAAAGMFNGPSSKGFIVGHAHPDPATRYALKAGIVDSGETLPMFGGVGIFAQTPALTLGVPLPNIGRATALTGAKALVGFSVIDQTYNAVVDPANPAPAVGSNQTIGFYTLGSRARLAVAADPSLINLSGGSLNQQVTWDFTNQLLIPYTAAHGAAAITNAVWSATNGGQITFTVGSDLSAALPVGSAISVSGVVNTAGTGGSTTVFNGEWDVLSSTGTTIVVASPGTVSPGTYASGGSVAAGGGALPVTVLDFLPTGNMVPVYNATTNTRTWNYSGAAAIIQLSGGTVA